MPSRVDRAVPSARMTWIGLRTTPEALLSGLDGDGRESVAMTSGAFSLIKLVSVALARVGRPARLDLWSWTISRAGIERLARWHQGGDVAVRVLIDGSLWRRQVSYARALDASGMPYRAATSHAKVAGLSGPQGSIFIAGSANANYCRRAEFLLLSRDAALVSWLSGLTDRAFEVLPTGSPRGDDERRAVTLEAAFPRPKAARPAWATGLPVLQK